MDRIPMIGEICYWPETIERWHKEGLPAQATPYDYFGLDMIQFFSYDGSLRLIDYVIVKTLNLWKKSFQTIMILISKWLKSYMKGDTDLMLCGCLVIWPIKMACYFRLIFLARSSFLTKKSFLIYAKAKE